MRVLHYSNSYYPVRGGIESVVENLCIYLRGFGVDGDVLTLNNIDRKKLFEMDYYKESAVYRVPFFGIKYYKISPIPFGIIKNYDLLHLHSFGFISDSLLLLKFLHKKKIVVSTHGGIFHTNTIPLLKKIYFFFWLKILLRNADAIIADSKQDFERFRMIAPEKKMLLIANGFSAPEPKGKKEKDSFLFVGRLSKNKGLFELLETFGCIKKNFHLRIAGNDFDGILSELKEKAKKERIGDKVDFLGGVSKKKLHDLYSKSEYAVSASKYEGFGITALEAMHHNCVCIFNSIPTFKEFCAESRGFIVDFSKPDKAAKIIEHILGLDSNEKASISGAAKEYSKQFLWPAVSKKFFCVYSNILPDKINRSGEKTVVIKTNNRNFKESFGFLTNLFSAKLRSVVGGKKIVHVLGDSHAGLFKKHKNFFVYPVGSGTAFNLINQNSSTGAGKKVTALLKKIPKKDFVLFIFGEIDCRIHVYKKYMEGGKKFSMKSIISETVRRYEEFISQVKSTGHKNIIVSGVPPTSVQKNKYNYKYYASRKIRVRITREFNRQLKNACLKKKVFFLDACSPFEDKNGLTKKIFRMDTVHLNKKALPVLEKKINDFISSNEA